jgi:hypothetical protein
MLDRARRLQKDIKEYITKYPTDNIPKLSNSDWKHVEYLIELLHPFDQFTRAISKVRKGPSIHRVFPIYNALFDHLNEYEDKLRRKTTPWKRMMFEALQNAQKKLAKYYKETTGQLGALYGIATILNPQSKIEYFEKGSWENETDDTGRPWVGKLLQ